MPLDPLPIYDPEKPMPTAHELRRIYEASQAAQPMFAALVKNKALPSDAELERTEWIHKALTRWLMAHTQVGAAWVGPLWEAQARAMLDALPSFDDVGRVGLLRTLYGVHSVEGGEPVVVVVAFDFVGVPHDIRLCRPRHQEPPSHTAHRATYDLKTALWVVRDTYAMNAGPRRQWVMEPSDADATDALAARLWAVVQDNPTPSHTSLLRALYELASVAVGHTDQTPTFDALALAFPQVAQAKAKAQAYALALQQEPSR